MTILLPWRELLYRFYYLDKMKYSAFFQVMKVNNFRYNLLYSLYSWPNVILSLIGGVLIDRVFGVRIGTVLFSALVTLGQVCTGI